MQKDYKHKKIKQVATTILGGNTTILLEIVDFKIDKSKTDCFFISIKQEDGSVIWTKESFAFYDILAMNFE